LYVEDNVQARRPTLAVLSEFFTNKHIVISNLIAAIIIVYIAVLKVYMRILLMQE